MKHATAGLSAGAVICMATTWAWPAAGLSTRAGVHLTALLTGATVAWGALLLLAIATLVGAAWGASLRQSLQTLAAPLPILSFLFIPLLALWPTVQGFVQAPRPDLPSAVATWLSPAFFTARAICYWLTGCTAFILWRAKRHQHRAAVFSAIAVSVTLTLSTFDWIMALAAPWQSTVLGVYVAAGSLVAGLSASTLLLFVTSRAQGTPIPVDLVRTLGRLLFALCFFWSYIAVIQALIIHMADLPDEVSWYLRRLEGAYAIETAALVIGHGVLPFGVLLFMRLKENVYVLTAMAVWCLAWHAVDMHWLVMPSVREASTQPALSAVACAGVACVVAAVSHWRLGRQTP